MNEPRDQPEKELEITQSFQEIAYWHDREAHKRKGIRWGAIAAGILIVSIGYSLINSTGHFNPAGRNWIWWLATGGRAVIILWLIARGALSAD